MKKLLALTLTLVLLGFLPPSSFPQDQPTQQPSAEDLEKEKAEQEKNAYRLLDQVIDEAQSLRLTENRVKIQINAADMLWGLDQGRARSLFSMAADGVAELGRTPATPNRRTVNFPNGQANFTGPPNMRSFQLRQELVLTVARHDAAFAYQLLAATKPPASASTSTDQRGPRAQVVSEDSLEQTLLGRIAALDPKLAAQNAEQMLEKGQFPRTVPEVINQLQRQDPEAAEKLADRTVKRIQSANILTNNEATALVQALLVPGPRPPASGATNTSSTTQRMGRAPVLELNAYIDLLSTVIDFALKASSAAQGPQRGNPRRVQVAPGANRAVTGRQPPTEAQLEQANARRLIAGLQPNLPLIDQYLPAKAALVRQKMSELVVINNPSFAQTFTSIQGNPTPDALIQAAATAPPPMQSRLYQQAAYRALEEGDTERARQIANDHLQNNARDAVMQRIDFREMVKKAEGARLDEIRQTMARLQTDNEKITLLVQLARDTEKNNPKLALQLLEDARQITNRRATSYEHFDQQLRVAHAFATLDPARSFEVLDPGISQINELLTAAAVLSGFEISMFRDGELTMQGGSGLASTITRYGQELALLARSDFERSEILAGRFQFAEARIMARLSIVQGLLGVGPSGGVRRE